MSTPIMMSQNREDAKDPTRSGELDFAVNREGGTEITQVAAKLGRIEDRLADIEQAVSRRRP